jgi:hypothetical protein
MRKIMTKTASCFCLVFLVFLQVSPLPVKAVETTYEATIEIDEGIASLSSMFDSIGRFTREGFAKVANIESHLVIDEYGNEWTEYIYSYGLIDINGNILLDAVYESINDYNDDYWIISKQNPYFEDPYWKCYGLISKQTGEVVIEPIYDGIPNIVGKTTITLSKTSTREQNGELIPVYEYELKSVKDGVIRDIALPAGISIAGSSNAYFSNIDQWRTVHVYWEEYDEFGNFSFDTLSWIVDDYGDSIIDFTFDDPRYLYVADEQTSYLVYRKDCDMEGNCDLGLIKIVESDLGYTYEEILSDQLEGLDITFYTPGVFSYFYYVNGEIVHGVLDVRVLQEDPFEGKIYLNYPVFSIEVDGVTKYGIKDKLGNVVIEPTYNYIYGDYYAWYILESPKIITVIDQPGETYEVMVYSIFDLNSGTIILDDLIEFPDSTPIYQQGYAIVRKTTGTANTKTYSYYDDYGNIIEENYLADISKYGILDKFGQFLLEPIYDSIVSVYQSPDHYKYLHTYMFGDIDQVETCGNNYYDSQTGTMGVNAYECISYNYGLFTFGKGIIIEPSFNYLTLGLGNYAKTHNFRFRHGEYEMYIDELGRTELLYWDGFESWEYGLLDMENGYILETIYRNIETIDPFNQGYEVPVFDTNDLVRIYDDVIRGLYGNYMSTGIGFADSNGVIIEPIYSYGYYVDGIFYMRDFDWDWVIIPRDNQSNKTYLPSNFITDRYIEYVEYVGNNLIVGVLVYTELGAYYEYGILNSDLSEFLPIEYSKITSDGERWYLEKYNDQTGTYSTAIMDYNGNFIVDFSSQYDTIGDYYNGYAIGQSVSVEEPVVQVAKTMSLSMVIEPQSLSTENIVHIIDVNGNVLGDLTGVYESATFIGIVDGTVKALVEKDGQFFIGSLVLTEVEGDTTPPVITVLPYELGETKDPITVYAIVNEGVLNATEHTFTENGSFTFSAVDEAGNSSQVTIIITNIVQSFPVTFNTVGDGGLSAVVDGNPINTGNLVKIGSTIDFTATPRWNTVVYQWSVNGIADPSRENILIIQDLQNDLTVNVEFVRLGDLNHDSKVGLADALMLLKHILGFGSLDQRALISADVNQDGLISLADFVKIRLFFGE